MCPIHESDSAEERWSQAEWEHYELSEIIEARARKVRRIWIAISLVLFLLFSAFPVVKAHHLRWKSLEAARELAQHLNQLKTEATSRQNAFRVRLDFTQPLQFWVEWGPSCQSPLFGPSEVIRLLEGDSSRAALSWVSSTQGREQRIAGLLEEWCFDPFMGSFQTPQKDSLAAFLLAPVKKLSAEEGAMTFVSGSTGEIYFE